MWHENSELMWVLFIHFIVFADMDLVRSITFYCSKILNSAKAFQPETKNHKQNDICYAGEFVQYVLLRTIYILTKIYTYIRQIIRICKTRKIQNPINHIPKVYFNRNIYPPPKQTILITNKASFAWFLQRRIHSCLTI